MTKRNAIVAYAICEICTLGQIASFALIEDPTPGAKLVRGMLITMAVIIAALMLRTAQRHDHQK